ncbi:capsule polysaccharide biosynthesis protein [Colletotrichum plurivorum]|uniref:Capsule polysaccharide biosynthesis protein n=1 Tax=Colletotrichum plurivorum TaxID=2175906 RepID=A0A8H6KB53_9PEZI|nr:capsule polysaccharide biosynthesis protein [Colletotrichum plurivorum]
MLRKRATEALPWSSPQPQGIGATVRARAIEAYNAAKPVLLRALDQASRWAAKNKGKTCLAVFAAALFCFNLKRLPFVWHLRVFSNIWFPRKNHFDSRPGSIFRPVVTSSRVSLLEMDYNLHKSNSTYFSDLDVARTDLLAALRAQAIRGGLLKDKDYKDGVQILLAGTSCMFKREIPVGAAFDMHSRILTWDRKWIYVVTHFSEKRQKSVKGKAPARSPAVYATAVSKCVAKAGRLTVPPERFFQAAGVLQPASSSYSSASDNISWFAHTASSDSLGKSSKKDKKLIDMSWVGNNASSDSVNKAKKDKKSKDKDSKKDKKDKGEKSSSKKHEKESVYVPPAPAAPLPPPPPTTNGWTWERVEEERVRGLKVAEAFASGLDVAHDEFRILG